MPFILEPCKPAWARPWPGPARQNGPDSDPFCIGPTGLGPGPGSVPYTTFCALARAVNFTRLKSLLSHHVPRSASERQSALQRSPHSARNAQHTQSKQTKTEADTATHIHTAMKDGQRIKDKLARGELQAVINMAGKSEA